MANGGSDTVSVIDTATNTVSATIAGLLGPVFDRHQVPMYYGCMSPTSSVTTLPVINTATRTVTATPPAPAALPHAVAASPDGTRVYVTNQYSNSVSVIDTTAATPTVIATVAVGATPSSVAASATRAAVTNQGGNSVTIINTTTATPTVLTTITNLPAGSSPTSVVHDKMHRGLPRQHTTTSSST